MNSPITGLRRARSACGPRWGRWRQSPCPPRTVPTPAASIAPRRCSYAPSTATHSTSPSDRNKAERARYLPRAFTGRRRASRTVPLHPSLASKLFRQRLEICDDVLPVFLVRHRVDHLRAVDEFAGALEPCVQVRFIPGDVLRLQGRRIIKAGYRAALAADDANDGPNLFSPDLVEWQGAQWAKIFSPAAASPSA